MQNSILLNDALQVRPTGIDIEDGIQAIKSATKREAERLWHTESVTYGEVVKATLGFAAFMAVVFFGGYLMGGVVA